MRVKVSRQGRRERRTDWNKCNTIILLAKRRIKNRGDKRRLWIKQKETEEVKM